MTAKSALDAFQASIDHSDQFGQRLASILKNASLECTEDGAAALKAEIAKCGELELDANFALFLRASFAVLSPDTSGQLLTKKFCPGGVVTVGTTTDISKHCIVLFEKTRPSHIRLTFSSCISSHPNLPAQMLWLMWVMPLLARVAGSIRAPEGATFLNQWDAGVVPGLAYCANGDNFFLIPDNLFIPTEGYRHLKQELLQNVTDWPARVPIAYWRGGTTGQVSNQQNWRSLPRVRLCELSRRYPEFIDAGLSRVSQFSGEVAAEITSSGLLRDFFPASKLQAYRYLIDIDGNTNAWGGLFERLLSGSTVLKVASPLGYTQWYYPRLRAWHNYVPVAADMSDLLSRIEWLKNHDDEAKRIGDNGRALAYSMEYEAELDSAVDCVCAAFRAYSASRIARPQQLSSETKPAIYTFHGTTLAYNSKSKALVHVPPEVLFLDSHILPITLEAEDKRVRFKTISGNRIGDIDSQGNAELDTIGASKDMIVVSTIKPEGTSTAFQIDGVFLCAESDGRITVSRRIASDWELFRLASKAALSEAGNFSDGQVNPGQ